MQHDPLANYKDPRVAKKKKLIERIRMQPHLKLLILDFVNYFMSLLSESDRKALIGDLFEQ